jgi:Mg2+-importing ATPase
LPDPGAAARPATFGPNRLPVRPVTGFGILLGQLRNPLLILLLAAAVVFAFTGDVTDAGIVTAIVVLSVGVGLVNEYRSARAVAALHGDIHYEAMVWRDGEQRELDVSALVPGDVVALRVGDVVPADLRIGEADQLECAEAVLTGESMAAAKTAEPVGPRTRRSTCRRARSWARRPSGRGTRRRGLDGLGDRVRRDRGRAR